MSLDYEFIHIDSAIYSIHTLDMSMLEGRLQELALWSYTTEMCVIVRVR